uniref:Putative secreted protein n=1 Tax=Panstrongylus lignarius TaxID=156445 RepID=A0A224Y6T0_9HEMI
MRSWRLLALTAFRTRVHLSNISNWRYHSSNGSQQQATPIYIHHANNKNHHSYSVSLRFNILFCPYSFFV